MKIKWLNTILTIFILSSIGAVGAAEVDDFSLQDNCQTDDILTVKIDQNSLSDSSATFTDLQNDIDSDDVVELSKNYTYDPMTDADVAKSGISISSPKVIDGKGFTIDASHATKIFSITSSNVTFKNIHFINANSSDCGAAIVACSDMKHLSKTLNNISIINCTFEDCNCERFGAVFTCANNVSIIDSTFTNNVAQIGGALYVKNGKNITVSNSKFNGNKESSKDSIFEGGGAICLDGCEAIICESTFEGNTAYNGGAIYVKADNVVLTGCNFTKNEASYATEIYGNHGGGGAIYMYGNNNPIISNCRFEENYAGHSGGAVFLHGCKNIKIDNSIFFNNSVVDEGGAMYIFYCINLTIGNCDFTQNKGFRSDMDSYGGAMRLHECNNTYIHDSNFTANYVNHNAGGAIEFHTNGVDNATIENCNFEGNHANSDGGAIYVHSKGEFNIIGCNFTNNYVIENQNVKSGGAVLINLKKEDHYTVWDNALKTKILNSNFINNTAPQMGGALCLRSNVPGILFEDNIIENCTFTGNNATWGSAIFLYNGVSANLTNVVFAKNRANSTSLEISVDKKKSFYPSDVTLTVTFKGKDNIVNAIWNGGHHNKKPFAEQDPSHVFLKNITYEIYHDGELKTVQVYTDKAENPVNGYMYADAGNNIWQDTRENAQNITIEIYNIEENTLVAKISSPLTEINGAMSNMQINLKPGNYSAKAFHKTDAYYTEASGSVDFEILPKVNLTLSKTPSKVVNLTLNETPSKQEKVNETPTKEEDVNKTPSNKNKIPVDIIGGNVTVHAGEDVVIPVKVIPRDGSVFNGNVTVELPDGTVKVIEIINGEGKVHWKVPKNYKPGKYLLKIHSNETDVYYPADGTGMITVIEENPMIPVDVENKTLNKTPSKKEIPDNSLAKHETGNPIFALLLVILLLGINIKRRK